MRDKSTNDLEALYESTRRVTEEFEDDISTTVSQTENPVEQSIATIVSLIDLDMDVPDKLAKLVKFGGKEHELITAIKERGLDVPENVINIIGSEEFGELDLEKPRWGDISDEEADDSEPESVQLNPAMQ